MSTSMNFQSQKARFAVAAILVTVITLATRALFPEKQIDDAYITFRYTYNLINHGQLVWNVGAYVEGQTNLLWSLTLALVAFLFKEVPIPVVAIWLCTISFIITGLLVLQTARRVGLGILSAAILTLAFQLTPPPLAFSIGGLESAFAAMLLALALHQLVAGNTRASALSLGLLFMTRPDAAIASVTLITYDLWQHKSLSKAIRHWWPAMLLGGATEIWRLCYYGHLIPNSVTAKSIPIDYLLAYVVNGSSIPYILSMLQWPTFYLMIIAVFIAMIGLINKSEESTRLNSIYILTVVMFFAGIATLIRNGGDWMPNYRLVTQYYPIYAISIAIGLSKFQKSNRILQKFLLTLLCIPAILTSAPLFLNISSTYARANTLHSDIGIDEFYVKFINIIKNYDTHGVIISTEAAGLPLYALPNAIGHDPLGLMDPWIAENGKNIAVRYGKFDTKYTFKEIQPDIAIYHSSGYFHSTEDLEFIPQKYVIRCFKQCENPYSAGLIFLKKNSNHRWVSSLFSGLPEYQFMTFIRIYPSASQESELKLKYPVFLQYDNNLIRLTPFFPKTNSKPVSILVTSNANGYALDFEGSRCSFPVAFQVSNAKGAILQNGNLLPGDQPTIGGWQGSPHKISFKMEEGALNNYGCNILLSRIMKPSLP